VADLDPWLVADPPTGQSVHLPARIGRSVWQAASVGAAERRLTVRDWTVAVGAALLLSVRVAVGPTVTVSGAGQAVTFALPVVVGAALLWRRRRPWSVAAVAVAASIVYALAAGPVLPVAGWLAVVVLARHVPALPAAVRGAVAAASLVIAGSAAGAAVHDRAEALPLAVSLTVVVLLAAVLARLQVARVHHQRDQRAAERRQAAADERLRIARDLHDLVGHGLSTIAVQSGAARLALDAGDPATARGALAAVEEASRGALAEMRQMLGVLRPGDAGSAPAPGLDRVDALAGDARAAGHQVVMRRAGPVDAVPAAVGLTAYRVLREAVTNAIRHAPGATIEIGVRAGEDRVEVEVCDDGTGGGTPAEGPRYGLVGLRERVAAAGGTLAAGHRPDGPGWRVAAALPLREETRP
jgi:signal transduction histidine kinase